MQEQINMKTQCKWAKSLGELEATHQETWGTLEYTDRNKPVVFFGLYDLRDYISLFLHRGKAYVLWAGSDILNLANGFVFNDGKLKWLSKILRGNWWVKLILKKAEHWVENIVEERALLRLGIKSKVCPSFLGNILDYGITYEWSKNPHVYISASEGRQIEYGFGIIEEIAPKLPRVIFHLYGASWETMQPNIIVHGRVSKEIMNSEIKNMQCGLRLNEFDGFSEITAKSILWGQYPITCIPNPFIPYFQTKKDLIDLLRSLTITYEPNKLGRNFYITRFNRFPWNEKLFNK